MNSIIAKRVILASMTLCLIAGLAACGKKAQPTPPDGATYPRQYPKPEADKPNPAKP